MNAFFILIQKRIEYRVLNNRLKINLFFTLKHKRIEYRVLNKSLKKYKRLHIHMYVYLLQIVQL